MTYIHSTKYSTITCIRHKMVQYHCISSKQWTVALQPTVYAQMFLFQDKRVQDSLHSTPTKKKHRREQLNVCDGPSCSDTARLPFYFLCRHKGCFVSFYGKIKWNGGKSFKIAGFTKINKNVNFANKKYLVFKNDTYSRQMFVRKTLHGPKTAQLHLKCVWCYGTI